MTAHRASHRAAPKRTPRAVRGAPALLAVEVGNSQTSIGVFQDDALVLSWRLRTEPRTPDEAMLVLRQLLGPESIDLARLPSVLCSVVPDVTSDLAHALTVITGHATLVVGPKTVPSLPLRVTEPTSVGPDRIANAIAGGANGTAGAAAMAFMQRVRSDLNRMVRRSRRTRCAGTAPARGPRAR